MSFFSLFSTDFFLNIAVSATQLTWTEPADPGADSVTYSVHRGEQPDLTDGFCLVSEWSSTTYTESTNPDPGEVFFYLIETLNPCGATAGVNSAGNARIVPVCS